MPFYLKELDVVPKAKTFKSTMIVICRFCPAASLALRKDRPYFKLFRHFINTASFEEYVSDIKTSLKKEGVKTGVLRGNMLRSPFNFIICMWNSWQRKKFVEQARQYESVIVLGCEAAYENVCDLLKDTDCQILLGMETEGVFSVTPKYEWPDTINIELLSVMPMETHAKMKQ